MADEPRLATESIAGLRPYQEDSVLAESLSDGRVLVAVADGMGGHAAGEVASALALETLVSALEGGSELDDAFVLANAKVHEMARDPGRRGMGTTLVAALIDDGEYFIANVGDSRGYLLSGNGIRQLTEDHSFVAEAMRRGQTEEEAMATPWRDALTRSIGTEPEVEVDFFGPFPVKPNTALLICSDGLYKTLKDDDLKRIFLASTSLRGAAQSLVAAAYENGSDDNISVVLAEHGEVAKGVGAGTQPMEYEPDPERDLGSPSAAAQASSDADTAEHEVVPMAAAAPAEADDDTAVNIAAIRAESASEPIPAPSFEEGLPPAAIVVIAVVAVILLVLALFGG